MLTTRYLLPLLLSAACPGMLRAQPAVEDDPTARERLSTRQWLWQHSANAAGLTLDTIAPWGESLFEGLHTSASHHRVQEGNRRNALTFASRQFRPIGTKLHAYGRFAFTQDREFHRAWSDVDRPTLVDNPFLSGSPLSGHYDRQQWEAAVRLGSRRGVWGGHSTTFGLAFDLSAGDLSRLRDPRPRAQRLDYRLAPALTLRITERHTLGLATWYARRKEKIESITTVQTDPNLEYFVLTGLENAAGGVGSYKGFQRQWVNHRFGGELSWGIHTPSYRTLTTLSAERRRELVEGQYRYEPGRYHEVDYRLASRHRLVHGPLLHGLDLTAGFRRGYADEFRQSLNLTTDTATGIVSRHYTTLLNFRKRHQVEDLEAAVAYHLTRQAAGGAPWTLGARAAYRDLSIVHLLPRSTFGLRSLDLALDGNSRLWSLAAGQLDGILTLTAHLPLRTDLRLADATTRYATGVLLPDAGQYYRAHTFGGQLSLRYSFPLTLRHHRLRAFVRAAAGHLHTSNGRSASTLGLSVGVFH